MANSTDVLEPLEGKSSTLFLVAGGLLVVFAANTGARVFAEGGYSAVQSTFGPAGFFLGIVGLVGLYPALAGQTPKLARVTGVEAAIPAIGWFIITVLGIGSSVGITPGTRAVFPVFFPILVVLTTILAYALFSVATLHVGVHSRVVSIGLLVPAVLFLTLIVGLAVFELAGWAEFAIDGGHALAHLAVGIALRTGGVPADPAEPAAEATP